MNWSWTGKLHEMGRILNCAEQQKLLWSVKVYNHIALSGLMLKGTLVISQTYASERTGCTALGQKAIFSVYFYLEIHEHNPTTIQQLEGIPGKDIHVCIYTYTYNTQHSHQSAFSQGFSLVHFSFTYTQSQTLWSLHPSRHLAEGKGAKRPRRREAEAKFSQWAAGDEVDEAPGLLDGGDQLERGGAEHERACGSVAPVPAGMGQVASGWCHYKTWMLTGVVPASPSSQAVGGRNGDTPALWLLRQEARRM